MSKPKKILHRCKIATLYSVVSVLVLIAVSVTVVRVFIPDLGERRAYIEEKFGEYLQRPVFIESMDVRLVGLSPTLIFKNVRMLRSEPKNDLISFDEIRLSLSVWDSLVKQQLIPKNFTISGVELVITRLKSGKFLIQGLGVDELGEEFSLPDIQGASSELADWLFAHSSLVFKDSTVIWHDLKAGQEPKVLKSKKLSLRNKNNRHQFTGNFTLPKAVGKKVELAFDVYGDILDPLKWVGKFYMYGDSVSVNEWGLKPLIQDVEVTKGLFDIQLWGEWNAGHFRTLKSDVLAKDLTLQRQKTGEEAKVKLLSGLIAWDHKDDDWQLQISNFNFVGDGGKWPETEFSFAGVVDKSTNKKHFLAKLDFIRIQDIHTLLTKSNYISDEQSEILNRFNPRGDLINAMYHFQMSDEGNMYSLASEFNGLATNTYKNIPGVKGLSGNMVMEDNSGEINFDADDVIFNAPDLFKRYIGLTRLQGKLTWQKNNKLWELNAKNIQVSNQELQAATDIRFIIPDSEKQSPFMSLYTRVAYMKGTAIKNYLPYSVMTPGLLRWIKSSIKNGEIKDGGISFYGRLYDFPFDKKQGSLLARFKANDVRIDYEKGWPVAYDGIFDAMITSQDLAVDITQVKMLKSHSDNTRIVIKDFDAPELTIKSNVKATLTDIGKYMTTTTILPEGKDFIENSRFIGSGDIVMNTNIPLGDEVKKISPLNFSGTLDVENVNAYLLNGKIDIENITGRWNFSKTSHRARGITATIQGGPAIIDAYSRNTNGGNPIEVVMRGNAEISTMMKKFKMPGWDLVHGKTDWNGAYTFKYKGNKGKIYPATFNMLSDFKNISSDMPPPMTKTAKSTLPSYMGITFTAKDKIIADVKFGDNLSATMDVKLEEAGARLLRGDYVVLKDAPAIMPKGKIMTMSGSLYNFSLRDWLEALDKTSDKKKQSFFGIPIHANMDYVQFKRNKNKEHRESAPPKTLPLMYANVKQIDIEKLKLGKTSFYTVHIENGIRLADIRIEDEKYKVEGLIDWTYIHGRHLTKLNATLSSSEFGKLFRNLGFASAIDGGEGDIQMSLSWPGSPGPFPLADLNGELMINIESGRFLKIDPGAGRLLGLFSLAALPRRLFLDFDDTFGPGFSFDTLAGEVQILDGNAYSEDLQIISPVATVNITGRTGLTDQDFDQYVTVIPQVSDSLALPGGLIFGAQVAVVIIFFQQLFGDSVDEAAQRIYHVGGTWEKPVIKQLNKEEETEEDPTPHFSDDDEEAA